MIDSMLKFFDDFHMFEFKHEICSIGNARRVAPFGAKIPKLSVLLSVKIRFRLSAWPITIFFICAKTQSDAIQEKF